MSYAPRTSRNALALRSLRATAALLFSAAACKPDLQEPGRSARPTTTKTSLGTGVRTAGAGGGQIIDLGFRGVAYAINNSGQIVGEGFGGDPREGFLWQNGVLIDLGQGVPRGINDDGRVVGEGFGGDPNQGVLWESGTQTQIPMSHPLAINNTGIVAGNCPTQAQTDPCLWTQASGLQDLGPVPGQGSGMFATATAINNNSEVTGYYEDQNFAHHAFVWTSSSGYQDLGTPLASTRFGGLPSTTQAR